MITTASETTPARAPSTVPAMVRPICDKCRRDGDLVAQTVQPGPWVFRYYLCRWHRAAWNRGRMDCQRKMTVLEYVDDATLLANKDLLTTNRRPTPAG